MSKDYDRAYFDKWYRSRLHRVISPADVRRKVSLALAMTEYALGRNIRNVLDVGCGEGAWQPHLRELRPRVGYTGVDPSSYAVSQFGRTRNIMHGSFAELESLRLKGPFDLVVCSDVMHYLTEEEIRSGMWELARLTGGVAFLEILTQEDEVTGDVRGMIRRPAAWYRKTFTRAGLHPIAPYCWVAPGIHETLAALELL